MLNIPELTVLMPTYNCGKFIYSAIKSVLAQNYCDFELIIIDDGSTDETENIVMSIIDKRIIYIKNRQNLGIVKSLNKGLTIARGAYTARMDADDIIIGNRFSEQVDFLKNNPDYGMVGGQYQLMNENGVVIQKLKIAEANEDIKLGLLFRNQFAHPAVTMRTDLVKALMYKDNYIYVEDYDLWCRISRLAKVKNLPSFYLNYRFHNSNTCSIKQTELKKNLISLLSRELKIYNIHHTTEELVLHAAICFGYGKRYFDTEQKLAKLNAWLYKIFSSKIIIDNFHTIGLEKFKKKTCRRLCKVMTC